MPALETMAASAITMMDAVGMAAGLDTAAVTSMHRHRLVLPNRPDLDPINRAAAKVDIKLPDKSTWSGRIACLAVVVSGRMRTDSRCHNQEPPWALLISRSYPRKPGAKFAGTT
jgi:hypothetical protein